jgi:N utilization substance protein A
MNSNPDDTEPIRRLFEQHVPEVASGKVEIRGIVREPGNRSILAVAPKNSSIDAVGSCVGIRGSRVKNMVSRLGGGEHFDIVLWSESLERFIANLLAPSRFVRVSFEEATRQANVVLAHDSPQAPPGRLPMKSKLLSQLTGWHLNVKSES